MTEHLLHGAQVAPPGQEVRGEGVAQRVRAHLVLEPRRLGVALHDLVQPLPRQPRPPVVDEQPVVRPVAHQPRARLGEVVAQRPHRLAPDRDDSFLGALPASPQHARLQVDVAHLQVHRLRGPQPAGVHDLQQRPVPQRGRLGPLRLGQELLHLRPGQDLRQALGALGPPQLGGGVVVDDLLPPQVAVERAQAGHLALDRGRGDRGPAGLAVGQLGDEFRELAMRDLQGADPLPLQEGAVLGQVRAVGLERVARQPPLQLQVGQEVERQVGERPRRGRMDGGGGHAPGFAPAARAPGRCNAPFSAARRAATSGR